MSFIEINDDDITRKIARISKSMAGDRTLFLVLGEELKKIHKKRFKEQKAPDGTPWKALNDDYANRKRPNSDKILTRRGQLANTTYYNADTKSVEFGSSLVYARIHQYGGRTGRGLTVDMPARPWLGVNNDNREILISASVSLLTKKLNKAVR